ncbi:MAG: exodeoxyribonuclease VII small subunit [Clostridiales bacterium]|nr:exodeoxyribonuclease VII small subunit [Clostridiales bacterium]HAW15233.1 exodeoxyribonuclease VII small subunit [Clostridiales bacterium]
MDQEKKFNVEESMNRLEEINRELSKSDIALEDSLKLYKEGVELAKKCKEHLEGVKKELEVIRGEGS